MNPITLKNLEDAGWTVECSLPLEIRHTDGSFASGQAAKLLIAEHTTPEFEPVSWKPVKSANREIRVDVALQLKGPAKFAIRSTGSCLCKDGEWEYEPSPSSRDDEFLARARYDTLAEAFETVQKFLATGKPV
jgi:hypothetical protein